MYPEGEDTVEPPPLGQVAFVVLAHMSFILAWSQGRGQVSASGRRPYVEQIYRAYEPFGSWSVWGQYHVHGLFHRLQYGDPNVWSVSIRLSRYPGQQVLIVHARTRGADEHRFLEEYIIEAIRITGGEYLRRDRRGDDTLLDR